MVRPGLLLGSLVVALAAAGGAPASNPEVTALRQQVKALRAEEKLVVKAVGARYDAVIQAGKLTEKQLAAERTALASQEKQYVALAATSADRTALRAQYQLLRKALSAQGRLDANTLTQLRAQKSAQTKLVRGLYKARITELNNLIRLAGQTTSTRKR